MVHDASLERPEGTDPYVVVRLSDERNTSGRSSLRAGARQAKREIVLGAPELHVKKPGGKMAPLDPWKHVIVPAEAIEVMTVKYRERKTSAGSENQGRAPGDGYEQK